MGTNNGVLSGNPTFESGEVAAGMVFDGLNDEVYVPAGSALDIGTATGMTIEFWINPSSLSGNRPVIEWNNGVSAGMHLWHSFGAAGRLFVSMPGAPGSADAFIQTGGGILTSGQWQHVAFAYDRGSGFGRLYRNGVEVGSKFMGTVQAQTTYNLYLGARPGGSLAGAHFAGKLDEVSLYSRALGATEVATIYNAGSAGKCSIDRPRVPLPSSAAAWWPLEGNANDVWGNNSGVLSGQPAFQSAEVRLGMVFDGIDDQVLVPAAPGLDLGGSGAGMSIEFWINPSSLNGNRPIVEWNNGPGTIPGMHFWHSFEAPGRLFVSMPGTFGSADGFIQTGGGILVAGQWQHVAFTYDRVTGVGKFYRNGLEVATKTMGTVRAQTTYNLYLGARPGAGAQLAGGLDEVTLYTRPLSGAEIEAIHLAGVAGKDGVGGGAYPPSVRISSPQNGEEFLTPVDLMLTADAQTSPDGSITNVEFYSGNVRLGNDTTRPFTFLWQLEPQAYGGNYALRAFATDTFGNVGTSAVVNVRIAGPTPLVIFGSAWAYLDTGVGPGANWTTVSFDDRLWASGLGPLGYGLPGLNSLVGFGPNANDKYISTYFRRIFLVPDITEFTDLRLELIRDDGAVVYCQVLGIGYIFLDSNNLMRQSSGHGKDRRTNTEPQSLGTYAYTRGQTRGGR